MLAIELVKVSLVIVSIILGMLGICFILDPTNDKLTVIKGNSLLILTVIALIIMFNI